MTAFFKRFGKKPLPVSPKRLKKPVILPQQNDRFLFKRFEAFKKKPALWPHGHRALHSGVAGTTLGCGGH